MIFAEAENKLAIQDQTMDDLGQRVAALEQIASLTDFIRVEDCPGETIDQKLTAATELLPRWPDHGGTLVLPSAKVIATDTWHWARKTDSPQPSDLFRGVTIIGNGCQIDWRGDGNKPIWDMPSPWWCRIEGPLSFVGNGQENVVALYHRPAWEYNLNTSRALTITQVHAEKIETAYYVGDPLGPDLVGTTLRECFFDLCGDAVIADGANVTQIICDNCLWSRNLGAAAISRGHGMLYFAKGEVKNHFGAVWSVDQYQTDAWKSRVFGEPGKEYAGGGGALLEVRGSAMSIRGRENEDTTYALRSELAPIYAQHLRIEGNKSGVLISTGPGNAHDTWCRSALVDVEAMHAKTIAIDHRGGYPLSIRGGTYYGAIQVADLSMIQMENVTSHYKG